MFSFFSKYSDKILHFLVNYGIVMTGFVFNKVWAILAFIGVSVVVSFVKEILDIKGSGFDWKDILADVAGIFVASVIGMLILIIWSA